MNETQGKGKVLVIEDNKDLAYLLCTVLIQLGYGADAAHNGPDGIKKAKRIAPDIILCDIGLPGMDGYGVAQVIRKDKSLKDVCLIALTGYASLREMDMAKEAGFNIHLSKPVSIAGLKRILDAARGLTVCSC